MLSLIIHRFSSISVLAALPPTSSVNLSHPHSGLAPTLSNETASGFSTVRRLFLCFINTKADIGELFGRCRRIRTSDPFVPNEVRYQAAPHTRASSVPLYQAREFGQYKVWVVTSRKSGLQLTSCLKPVKTSSTSRANFQSDGCRILVLLTKRYAVDQ